MLDVLNKSFNPNTKLHGLEEVKEEAEPLESPAPNDS